MLSELRKEHLGAEVRNTRSSRNCGSCHTSRIGKKRYFPDSKLRADVDRADAAKDVDLEGHTLELEGVRARFPLRLVERAVGLPQGHAANAVVATRCQRVQLREGLAVGGLLLERMQPFGELGDLVLVHRLIVTPETVEAFMIACTRSRTPFEGSARRRRDR